MKKKIDKEVISSRRYRNNQAKKFLQLYCKRIKVDYYKYYKNKFVNQSILEKEKSKALNIS